MKPRPVLLHLLEEEPSPDQRIYESSSLSLRNSSGENRDKTPESPPESSVFSPIVQNPLSGGFPFCNSPRLYSDCTEKLSQTEIKRIFGRNGRDRENDRNEENRKKEENQKNQKNQKSCQNKIHQEHVGHVGHGIHGECGEFKPGGRIRKRKRLGERLDDVCRLLVETFNGDSVSLSLETLPPIERRIFTCVIDKVTERVLVRLAKKKRNRYRILSDKIQRHRKNESYDEIVRELIGSSFVLTKRKEEKVKFVFKNTFNFFRRRFLDDRHLKLSRETELVFLKYYFQSHRELFETDYESFSDPLNTSLSVNPSHKTLSDEYFGLVFAVPSFKRAFFGHLDKRFRQDYLKSSFHKFKKLLEGLYAETEFCLGEEDFGRYVEKWVAEMEQKKVVKLPWTSIEVDDALAVFRQKIKNLDL